jgi:hypothetical protein
MYCKLLGVVRNECRLQYISAVVPAAFNDAEQHSTSHNVSAQYAPQTRNSIRPYLSVPLQCKAKKNTYCTGTRS